MANTIAMVWERPRVETSTTPRCSLTEPPSTNWVPTAAALGDGGDGSLDDARCGGGGDDDDDSEDDRLALLVSAVVGDGLFGCPVLVVDDRAPGLDTVDKVSRAEDDFLFPLGTGGFLAECFLALPRRPPRSTISASPPPPPPPSRGGGEATHVDDSALFLPLDPFLFFALRVSRCLEAFCNVCRP